MYTPPSSARRATPVSPPSASGRRSSLRRCHALPGASAALVDGLGRLAGLDLDATGLHQEAKEASTRLGALVAESDEHQELVRQLEAHADTVEEGTDEDTPSSSSQATSWPPSSSASSASRTGSAPGYPAGRDSPNLLVGWSLLVESDRVLGVEDCQLLAGPLAREVPLAAFDVLVHALALVAPLVQARGLGSHQRTVASSMPT